jgi:hypothetical protein
MAAAIPRPDSSKAFKESATGTRFLATVELRKTTPASSYAPEASTFHFVEQMATGQRQGLGLVYQAIQQQSAMLAFNDIYRRLALIALVTVPSFVLFQSAKRSASVSPAH